MKRHTKNSCFKLHGYPDWYKNLKPCAEKKPVLESNKNLVNMLESPLDFVDEVSHHYGDLQANMDTMIQQGIERYMKGKQVAGSGETSTVNYAHLKDFAGSTLQRIL
ncbi:hypothetical protein Sjap_017416 [Stephania japonica]|uniref:Uncharacterized protein n=1 Tax=Stephania japonica TaxID=461633 RepID=A0AAP0I645_9MAGN